ncbi:D-2-hydroxyacid dehydrogenase [Heyndrickxia acidicola]|uniref:D-2-hydroxyacid dehydrogenase n=1 Tax=Heyndrickxia acidicola TaxID=209389 RepID=A0ABU6MJC9_9BACI|nr:D-2-hydroxyacid dehydrogenase [Heyndrickxia acidicola]MED1204517.1 D-2-hydroxyacid dehydrogenase [Heyndrickxia acidicola]
MAKRKVVITQNIDENYINAIRELLQDWEVIAGKDSSIWSNHIKDAEIIVGWKKELASSVSEQESKVRWIQTWSAGVDSLPLEKLEARDIQLTSANGVHAYPISETIFALMLSLTRKIPEYVRNQQKKKWDHSGLKLEIHEKTIGILGIGAIGKETAKIAKAFGMRVIGVRNSLKNEENVDKIAVMDELHSVLPECDYVVNTLPLTNNTRNVFGAKEFSLMKISAFFINIGRGETVVEKELIHALQEEQIAGAGLDVFENEPLDQASPLWDMENVIITPHTAGSTEYYDKRVLEDIFIPNLKNYLTESKPFINVVDYGKGY